MADNAGYTPGSGALVAADEVTYSGDTAIVQLSRLVHVTGTEGSKTVQDIFVTTDDPSPDDPALMVAPRPQDTWVCSFARSGSALLTDDFTQRRLGTGVGVSQSGGNLVLTTGTTANSEYLVKSTVTFRGAWIARAQVQLSQRIANQNFAVLLADSVGEGLTCTINSATSITVTLSGHTFTADNVGQFLFVGAITGANGVPGRYAIASVVAGTSITLTVAGWPASGSCTVDLFGWNWVRTLYSGTTATNAAADAQRRGWNSSDTTLTVQSTASPGHIVQMAADGRNVYWSDTLAASAAAPVLTTRGSRMANMPDQDVPLHVFLWLFNGSTAPASTTTWTIGFVSVEDTVNLPVYLAGNRAQSMPMPVVFPASQPVTASGTVGVTGYPTAAASADALANPTVTKLDALGLLFNGATWDRARNNHNVAVETSSARTTTGTGTTQTNFNASGAFIWINVTAVTGTTPTLTVRVQWSPDGGTTWLDLDTTNAQTASITGTGSAVLRVFPGITTAANAALNAPLPRTWRLAWTIGGTTPSFTFSAQASYIRG